MKLKIHILNRLISDLNSKEINLLIYLAQRQEESTGIIKDIYYKDVVECTFISQSHFYNCLRSLEKKGFIIVDYSNSNSKFYTVRILNNNFPFGQKKEKYLNLNYRFLHTGKFMSLDASMKKFLLRVFSLKDAKEQLDFTPDKLKEYNVLHRIEELKMFLSVKEYNNKFYFRVISELTTKDKFELNTYLGHKLKAMCNKFGIKFNKKEFQDTLEVYAYYYSKNEKNKTSNKYLSRIMKALDICIEMKRLIPAMIRNVCKTNKPTSKEDIIKNIAEYGKDEYDYFDTDLEEIFRLAIFNNL
ncbi:MAG: hypothetical protein N4A54_04170 [Peptostreptococcaceae bacterium]|nr:hypothetical protein [Peptostreptococcaceae bacterium]